MLLALHANPDSIKGQLVSFRISNGALDAKDLPKRLKLLNWGVNKTVKGPVTVNSETAKQLPLNQAKTGFDRVALDYNHQTVPGSEEYERIIKLKGSIDPLPVAAYGTPIVIPGDGLWLENLEWTPDGEKHAANYHDLSPTPQLNDKGEVVFLHSAALCRQGAVDDLHFYNASFLNLKHLSTPTMDTPAPANAVDYKALLISLLQKLGLTVADGASDSDIASSVDQFKAPEKPAPAAPAAAAPANDDNKPMTVGQFKTLMAASTQDADRTNLVTLASQQGKVIPLSADLLKTIPVPLLKEMVEKLPVTVPLNSTTRPGEQPAVTVLSADEKLICQTLSISEEVYLKQKKADGGTRAAVV